MTKLKGFLGFISAAALLAAISLPAFGATPPGSAAGVTWLQGLRLKAVLARNSAGQ